MLSGTQRKSPIPQDLTPNASRVSSAQVQGLQGLLMDKPGIFVITWVPDQDCCNHLCLRMMNLLPSLVWQCMAESVKYAFNGSGCGLRD